jgi:hypothetical protein
VCGDVVLYDFALGPVHRLNGKPVGDDGHSVLPIRDERTGSTRWSRHRGREDAGAGKERPLWPGSTPTP